MKKATELLRLFRVNIHCMVHALNLTVRKGLWHQRQPYKPVVTNDCSSVYRKLSTRCVSPRQSSICLSFNDSLESDDEDIDETSFSIALSALNGKPQSDDNSDLVSLDKLRICELLKQCPTIMSSIPDNWFNLGPAHSLKFNVQYDQLFPQFDSLSDVTAKQRTKLLSWRPSDVLKDMQLSSVGYTIWTSKQFAEKAVIFKVRLASHTSSALQSEQMLQM